MIRKSLDSIATLTDNEKAAIIDLHSRLVKITDIRDMILIGSKARGDFHEGSDIDIVVNVKGYPDDETVFNLLDTAIQVGSEYGVTLSTLFGACEVFDEEEFPPEYEWIADAVEKDGIRFVREYNFVIKR